MTTIKLNLLNLVIIITKSTSTKVHPPRVHPNVLFWVCIVRIHVLNGLAKVGHTVSIIRPYCIVVQNIGSNNCLLVGLDLWQKVKIPGQGMVHFKEVALFHSKKMECSKVWTIILKGVMWTKVRNLNKVNRTLTGFVQLLSFKQRSTSSQSQSIIVRKLPRILFILGHFR